MSIDWEEVKEEIENAIDKCKHNHTDGLRRANFCEKLWMSCAHAIATGQCEVFNRVYNEVEDANDQVE